MNAAVLSLVYNRQGVQQIPTGTYRFEDMRYFLGDVVKLFREAQSERRGVYCQNYQIWDLKVVICDLLRQSDNGIQMANCEFVYFSAKAITY